MKIVLFIGKNVNGASCPTLPVLYHKLLDRFRITFLCVCVLLNVRVLAYLSADKEFKITQAIEILNLPLG